MKIKFLLSLFLGSALSMSAQAYLDGVEYYRADQFYNSKTILERTLNDADTDKATAYYYLGQVALKYNEADKAQDYFNKGVAANPENPYNYVGLATIALKNGDKKGTESNVKLAKKYAKKDAQLYVDIARMYFDADAVANKKDIDKAMKEALKKNPQEPAYFIFIGDTLRQAATTNTEIGEAAANYDNAIYYAPNSAVAYVKYSGLYKDVNRDFSISKMKEYLGINPNSALAQCELADRLYDAGRWTQAFEAYDRYIKNPAHFVQDEERYATLLMSGEKYEEAFQVAKGVIGRTENPNQMYRIMMHCKNTLEDYPEAAKWAAELMKSKGVAKIIDVDHVTYGDILASLAKVDTANMAQHYEAAINQFNEALAVNNKCEDAYKSMANTYRSKGDYVNSIATYEKFVELGLAKAGDYHNFAGVLLNHANKLSQTDVTAADVVYDRAVAVATEGVNRSNSPYAQERKAIILYSKNSGVINADVAQAFEKVVELLDSNEAYKDDAQTYTTALSVIDDYYAKEGNKEKALAAYTRYTKFNPNNEKVNNKIAALSK